MTAVPAIALDISDGMGLLGKSDLAVNPAR